VSAERAAYNDARLSVEGRRERLIDAAVEAWKNGENEEADELIDRAKVMQFTGLDYYEDDINEV
jgi:hypothetical protein